MTDDVAEVRDRFLKRLHKGLGRIAWGQGVCLPQDFLGFYALVGFENKKEFGAAARGYLVEDIKKRNELMMRLQQKMDAIGEPESGDESEMLARNLKKQISNIMPENILAYSVPLLTHSPKFEDPANVQQLKMVENCLRFVLEPFISGRDDCLGFYRKLIGGIKNCRNGVESEDPEKSDQKMYSICDLVMKVLAERGVLGLDGSSKNAYPAEPRIPTMYFKRHEIPNWVNDKDFLPKGMRTPNPSQRSAGYHRQAKRGRRT